ncbi:MAG: LPXTG cell wall anchor domain-containing protein [Actinomycetota bacterium]
MLIVVALAAIAGTWWVLFGKRRKKDGSSAE